MSQPIGAQSTPNWWAILRGIFVRANSPTETALSPEQVILKRGGVDLESVRITDTLLSPDPVTGATRTVHALCLEAASDEGKSTQGQSKNIVLCHGYGAGSGFYYRNVGEIARLVPGSRVWAVDWLGMGLSSRPPFPLYTQQEIAKGRRENHGESSQEPGSSPSSPLPKSLSPAQQVVRSNRAIEFFLESFEEWRSRQAGLERMVLVGHSLGGYLAALYALRHPERVERLILASPVGLPACTTNYRTTVTGHELPPWLLRIWQANYTPQWLMRTLGPLGKRLAYGYVANRFPYLGPEERDELGAYMHQITSLPGSGEYALNAILAPGAWAREPLHHHLANLQMPCTFLYGSYDWMDYEHAVEAAQQMRVPTKIIRVENSGHQLFLDNPESFNRHVAHECKQN